MTPASSYEVFIGSYNGRSEYDDVRVRKYASPEPSAVNGTEESLTTMAGGAQNWAWKAPAPADYVRSGGAQDWNWKPFQQYLGRYRKPISIAGSTSALTQFQVNVTPYIYNETGLVGSWHFSESSGNATADSSGGGNTGYQYGTSRTTGGKFGNAIKFDGVDDYVEVPDSSSLHASYGITIEAWVKINKFPASSAAIIEKMKTSAATNSWTVRLESGGDIRWQVSNGAADIGVVTNPLRLGEWVHYAFVYDPSNTIMYTYVNGTQDNSYTYSGITGINVNDKNVRLGWEGGGNNYFNGTIDEVRIYNRTLSASEIAAHYQAKARLDYQDIRFTDSDGATLLPFWMESDGKFWVRVPSIPTTGTTIYAYYGNPQANDAQNGTGTFEFFDDFLGSSLSADWTTSGTQTIDVSNGILTRTQGAAFASIYNNVARILPYAVRTRANVKTPSSSSTSLTEIRMSDNPTTDAPTNLFTIGFTHLTTGNYRWWATASGATAYADAGNIAMDNLYHIFESKIKTGEITNYIDNVLQVTDTTDIPSSAMKLEISGQANAGQILVDWIAIRKYASPEPSAVNGTEEDSPIPQNITVPVGGAMNWTWYPAS